MNPNLIRNFFEREHALLVQGCHDLQEDIIRLRGSKSPHHRNNLDQLTTKELSSLFDRLGEDRSRTQYRAIAKMVGEIVMRKLGTPPEIDVTENSPWGKIEAAYAAVHEIRFPKPVEKPAPPVIQTGPASPEGEDRLTLLKRRRDQVLEKAVAVGRKIEGVALEALEVRDGMSDPEIASLEALLKNWEGTLKDRKPKPAVVSASAPSSAAPPVIQTGSVQTKGGGQREPRPNGKKARKAQSSGQVATKGGSEKEASAPVPAEPTSGSGNDGRPKLGDLPAMRALVGKGDGEENGTTAH